MGAGDGGVGTVIRPPGWLSGVSPQTEERDRAIAIARRVLSMSFPPGAAGIDVTVLARQYLRALGLPESA